MTEPLPRPTFKTEAHARAELEIAGAVTLWTGMRYLHIGDDDPFKQKTRIDGLFYRPGRVEWFAELKDRSMTFRSEYLFVTGEKKIKCCRALYELVRVPVLLVVRFGCGTIARIDTQRPYRTVANFGRSDRDSPGDRETGAGFVWSDFVEVG